MARIVLVIVLVLIGLGLLVWRETWSEPTVVSGYIEADEIRVGSRVGGRVREVLVDEGDAVQKGQILVRLDPFDLLERLAQAKAELAASESRLAKLKAGFRPEEVAEAKAVRDQAQAALEEAKAGPRAQEIAAARDQVALHQAELDLAQQLFTREDRLLKANAGSQEDFDQASKGLSVAKARLETSRAQLNLLEEGTREEVIAQARAKLAAAQARFDLYLAGSRKEDIDEARAAVDAAKAHSDALTQQVAELEVRAPADSVVQAIELEPGDLTSPNAPVATLIPRGTLWIRAYLPEKWLGWVETDQEVQVAIDSFPDKRFPGRIVYIANQAEFTPSNIQTPEERSQQVYRIKVELPTGDTPFKSGMAADVYLARPEEP